MVGLYYMGRRTRKGSGVSEEVRRTPEQPLVQAAASVSGAAQDGGFCEAKDSSPRHYQMKARRQAGFSVFGQIDAKTYALTVKSLSQALFCSFFLLNILILPEMMLIHA